MLIQCRPPGDAREHVHGRRFHPTLGESPRGAFTTRREPCLTWKSSRRRPRECRCARPVRPLKYKRRKSTTRQPKCEARVPTCATPFPASTSSETLHQKNIQKKKGHLLHEVARNNSGVGDEDQAYPVVSVDWGVDDRRRQEMRKTKKAPAAVAQMKGPHHRQRCEPEFAVSVEGRSKAGLEHGDVRGHAIAGESVHGMRINRHRPEAFVPCVASSNNDSVQYKAVTMEMSVTRCSGTAPKTTKNDRQLQPNQAKSARESSAWRDTCSEAKRGPHKHSPRTAKK